MSQPLCQRRPCHGIQERWIFTTTLSAPVYRLAGRVQQTASGTVRRRLMRSIYIGSGTFHAVEPCLRYPEPGVFQVSQLAQVEHLWADGLEARAAQRPPGRRNNDGGWHGPRLRGHAWMSERRSSLFLNPVAIPMRTDSFMAQKWYQKATVQRNEGRNERNENEAKCEMRNAKSK